MAYITHATCHTLSSIWPNTSTRSNIAACQAAANTTYCYPPNGTRICVPANDIPCTLPTPSLNRPSLCTSASAHEQLVFWPPAYYHTDSRIALAYDPDPLLFLSVNNTGNDTYPFTQSMYTNYGEYIPNQSDERSLQMYLLERRFGPDAKPFNLATHIGPELVLVKTASFTSTIYSSATATPTSSSSSGYRKSGGDRLGAGAIIGVVIAALLGVLVIVACCRGCCGGGSGRRERPGSSEGSGQAPEMGQREERNVVGPESAENAYIARRVQEQLQEERRRRQEQEERSGNQVQEARSGEQQQERRSDVPREEESLPPYERDEPPKYTP